LKDATVGLQNSVAAAVAAASSINLLERSLT
jgi:hypothetical protein